ncbi:MAG: hypothetical protein Kow00127_18270 [Bacteroidales bacterium]
MSKIVGHLLEDVTWLHDLSGILTLFFALMFALLVIRVLRWDKKSVEQYKRLPLSDQESSQEDQP